MLLGETRQISLYKGEFFNTSVAAKELLKLGFPKIKGPLIPRPASSPLQGNNNKGILQTC
jgi:hypothetical protein